MQVEQIVLMTLEIKIVNFVGQMISFGKFKVVLLDEADYLSPKCTGGTTWRDGRASANKQIYINL